MAVLGRRDVSHKSGSLLVGWAPRDVDWSDVAGDDKMPLAGWWGWIYSIIALFE